MLAAVGDVNQTVRDFVVLHPIVNQMVDYAPSTSRLTEACSLNQEHTTRGFELHASTMEKSASGTNSGFVNSITCPTCAFLQDCNELKGA